MREHTSSKPAPAKSGRRDPNATITALAEQQLRDDDLTRVARAVGVYRESRH